MIWSGGGMVMRRRGRERGVQERGGGMVAKLENIL